MIHHHLKISVETHPGRCPHGTSFFLNHQGCREVSHQRWHPSWNLVRIHYGAACGEMSHWKGKIRIYSLFKRQEKLMINRVDLCWRICTRRYIHLFCHLNVVFTRYLRLHTSLVTPWRRGRSGSYSCILLLDRYHIPYSSSFTAARCSRVFSLLQKCFLIP